MIRFVIDSSGDSLSKDLVEQDKIRLQGADIKVAPLLLYTDTHSFLDDENLNVSEMIAIMEKHSGRSYTSCPATDAWVKSFEGADEIYVITITSGLSGTYNSALSAKEVYLQDHPEAKIEIFDSLSTGPGMRLILEKLVELTNEGKPFEEVCSLTREYMKTLSTFFNLPSLHNLAENGRVNKLVAKAIGVMGISMIGKASETGTIEVIAKSRGSKKVIATLVEQIEKAGYQGGKLRICHVENPELAQAVVDAVKEKFGKTDALYYSATGLCSFYAERGGLILAVEK